jgi:hypothetical protein
MLCPICESKLRSGQIREADVQASKALLQVAGHVSGAASLVRSFTVDGNYILELDHSGLAAFRNNPEALAELQKLLGERVWLARASGSNREFVEDLLHPVKVLALGTVWLPDGTKIAKAIVAGGTSRRARELESIKRMAKEVRGIDLVVESDGKNQFLEKVTERNLSQHGTLHAPPASNQAIDIHAPPLEITGGRVSLSTHIGHDSSALTQSERPLTHMNERE